MDLNIRLVRPFKIFSIAVLSLALLSPAAGWAQNACSSIFEYSVELRGQVRTSSHPFGEVLHYTAHPSLKGPLKSVLKLGTYNILNLYEHIPGQEKYYEVVKDRARRIGNARAIKEIDPDFQVLVEVENTAALQRFNDNYLESRYEPLLIQGNDSRGIDVAVLVKRDLPIEMEWRSYKKFNNTDGQYIFTRDLPVGLVYGRDASGKVSIKPDLILIAAHYKSKRSKPGQGDASEGKRLQEVLATVDIVSQIRREFGEDAPIFLAGDFNNSVHEGREFTPLFSNGFKDTLDLVPSEQAVQDRSTHSYFPHNGPRETNQIDAILTLSNRVRILKGRVIPDYDQNGNILPLPESYAERENRPSDHRPIGIEVELKPTQ